MSVPDDATADNGEPYRSQCPSCMKLYTYPPNDSFVCEQSKEECGWNAPGPFSRPNVNRPELIDIQNTNAHREITIISFSYKNGVPEPKPLKVIDVRQCIRNPWRDPNLRKLTGLDAKVQEFIANCKGTANVLLVARGVYKSNQTIAIGCMGGKHRSVAIAEVVGKYYMEKGWNVTINHRDLKKDNT